MPLSEIIQRIIYLLEVGAGSRWVRLSAVVLLFALRCLWLDLRDYKNLSAAEAMDAAQVARNVAEGRGYTTEYLRPFSIYLVRQWNEAQHPGQPASVNADFARVQQAHPDLANPPAYVLFLAGCMRVLPFDHQMEFNKSFWSEAGHFARDKSDVLIATVNQLLLAVVLWQMFLIARKLFDVEVAWVTAALGFACELLWDFSFSGLSTIFLLVIFLELVRRLLAFAEAAREPVPAHPKLLLLALAIGALAGLGALTRYAFGWILLPVVVYVLLAGGPRRWTYALSALGAALVLLVPWLLRNYSVCGLPFGTAGYALLEGTQYFPGNELTQSLHPHLERAWLIKPYWHKFWPNFGTILSQDWPRLGGSWVTMLFFASLLVNFRSPAVRRLRYFLLLSLVVFTMAQALGRTELTTQSPVLTSENLLVLLLPLILMYGAVFFLTCLDQVDLPVVEFKVQLRYFAMIAFILLMSLPTIGRRFSEKANPLAFPPYYPPEIQTIAHWMKPNELIMSDVPWAVAWYGHRQCVWTTLNTAEEYYGLSDFVKPVQGLYLTAQALDLKLLSDCLRTPPDSWGTFVLKTTTTGNPGFPLQFCPNPGVIKSGLFLTDRARWLNDGP